MIQAGPGGITSRPALWWFLALVALIQGCASMNEAECQNADWRTIGYEDGARGAAASRIGEHREACAGHSISPDLGKYRQGREEGLRQYCRPPNGFQLGERGASYTGVCPRDLEPDFLSAYKSGKQLHNIAADVRATQSRLASKEQELAALKSERQSRQVELVSKGLSTARRAELVLEVLELSSDQGAVEKEISRLKAELDHRRGVLAQAKAENPYRY